MLLVWSNPSSPSAALRSQDLPRGRSIPIVSGGLLPSRVRCAALRPPLTLPALTRTLRAGVGRSVQRAGQLAPFPVISVMAPVRVPAGRCAVPAAESDCRLHNACAPRRRGIHSAHDRTDQYGRKAVRASTALRFSRPPASLAPVLLGPRFSGSVEPTAEGEGHDLHRY